jgi:hypothetical protein
MKRNNLTPLALVAATCLALLSAPAQAQAKGKSVGQELEAPVAGAVTVSDFELNTFVFPAAIKRVYFPAGSPVLGSPIYLSDNTQVMLQFSKGHDKPVQMVAELEDGQVVQLRVVPRPVAGVVHSVNGARVRARSAMSGPISTEGAPVNAAPRGEDIEMLKHLITTKEAHPGFEPVSLPGVTAFDKFSVVPLAAWSNGLRRLMIFSLVSAPGQTAVVANPQFYRPGITAVLLDGDVVDARNSPKLFIVEELNDE